jgi:heme/copper-type cytochrome/quinol oxidase subunit 2
VKYGVIIGVIVVGIAILVVAVLLAVVFARRRRVKSLTGTPSVEDPVKRDPQYWDSLASDSSSAPTSGNSQ